MSIMRFINDRNRGVESLAAICKYASRDGKLPVNQISGLGIPGSDIFQGMMLSKVLHHQKDGKAYQHLVLSNNSELQDVQVAHAIGVKVARYYADRFQVAVYTHTDTNNLHSHIIINTVDMITGKKLVQNRKVMKPLLEYINSVLNQYGQPEIGGCDIIYYEDIENDDYEYDDYENDDYFDFDDTEHMALRILSLTMENEFGVVRPFYFMDEDEELKEILAFKKRMEMRRTGSY